jgi:type I restriction enzyme S subunit
VVNLAVTGRLIQSSSENDSATAQEVLRLALVEKDKLIAAGEARRSRPETSLPSNGRLAYPKHWAEARLENVIHLISGQHLGHDEQNTRGHGIPYLTGASDFGPRHPKITRWTDQRRATAKRGDIVLAVKGTIGKFNFVDVDETRIAGDHPERFLQIVAGGKGKLVEVLVSA